MSNRGQRRVLLLIAIVIGIAVLGPAIFGEPREQSKGDPWRNFVFDFQTLLTGIFAVSAAAWTVLTMETTDARSEERHRQLMAVSLRSEVRAIDRALNPQMMEIEELLDDLWSEEYDPFASGVNNWIWFGDLANSNYSIVKELQRVMSRKQISDAMHYFDGDLLMAHEEFVSDLTGVSDDLRKHITALDAHKRGDWAAFEPYSDAWEDSELFICGRAVMMIENGKRFVDAMKRTLDEYKTLKTRFRI